MKRLLAVLALSGALVSGPAYANHHGGGSGHGEGHGKQGRSFEEVKANRLKKIDELRACVARAKSFEEMKACHGRPKYTGDHKIPKMPSGQRQ